MSSTRTILTALSLALPVLATSASAQLRDEIFYTRYEHGPDEDNVKSAIFNWEGGTLTIESIRGIANVGGADGLTFAPDGDLVVGGQSNFVYKLDPEHGKRVQTASTGPLSGAYHVVLDPSETKVWTGGQPGLLVEVPLNPFGDGTAHGMTGDDPVITQVAFDPAGRTFYTASDPTGIGNFGIIDLNTFTTTRLLTGIQGAHGMSFDDWSNTLLVYGTNRVLQIDTATNSIVGDLDLTGHPGLSVGFNDHFDQGAPSGEGQVLLAVNNGNLFIVDYAASGRVDDPSTVVAYTFLDRSLDDVAPLSGLGARPNKGPRDNPKDPKPGIGGKVTGGGRIAVAGGFASFGFNAKGTPTEARGHLNFINHVTGEHLRSTSVDSLTIQGGIIAIIGGTCTLDGAPCTFQLTVEDHGEPGTSDEFRLSINSAPELGQVIENGNIQVHK